MRKLILPSLLFVFFLGCSSSKQQTSFVDTRFGRYEYNPDNEKYIVSTLEGKVNFQVFENAKLRFYKETVVEIENIIKNDFYQYCIQNKENISKDALNDISKGFVKNYQYRYMPVNSKMDTLDNYKYSYYVVYKIDKKKIKNELYDYIKNNHKSLLTPKIEKYFQ